MTDDELNSSHLSWKAIQNHVLSLHDPQNFEKDQKAKLKEELKNKDKNIQSLKHWAHVISFYEFSGLDKEIIELCTQIYHDGNLDPIVTLIASKEKPRADLQTQLVEKLIGKDPLKNFKGVETLCSKMKYSLDN